MIMLANRLHLLSQLRKRTSLVTYSLLAVVYLVWVVTAYLDQWPLWAWLAMSAFFWAVPVLIASCYFLSIPISTRKNYRDHKTLHRPYTYAWSETELVVSSASGEWHLAWSDFLKWNESEELFVFYQAPKLFNVVPKRALSAEQVDDLRQCAGRIGG